MDPALLQTSTAAHGEGQKASFDSLAPTSPDNQHQSEEESQDEDASHPLSSDVSKRPRLRLAHACDRCKKRKIRCDTHQPCAPCQAAKNECTFKAPSRRVSTKPKGSFSGEEARPNSFSGFKRPHSPSRPSLEPVEGQSQLEARLAALEAMLGDVPPQVHNAFLASLDARLGSGTGVGIKEGQNEGVGVAFEALSRGSGFGGLGNLENDSSSSWTRPSNGLDGFATSQSEDMLGPDWSKLAGVGWQDGTGLWKRKEEEGVSEMAKRMEGMSFFYEDEIGQAKWQGATSGFPLLVSLTAANARSEQEINGQASHTSIAPSESPSTGNPFAQSPLNVPSVASGGLRIGARHTSFSSNARSSSPQGLGGPSQTKKERFFPDRTPRPHQTLNPEASWKVITGVIPPDLMDTLVRCYLSTSHLLWPFLNVPSFLQDYANPQQWGEPGFACFIVAVCTLSSRHVDDPRVRASPQDPSTAGKQYFELFKRLRDLPSAERPTLYSIQAAFLAGIYAFGLGNLSKAFALQAESITLCLDGGLHRSVDGYDHFDAVEKESRKRTFWSIYSWDKQSAALFGRPPIIHLRDCDVTEPLIVDDENLTPEGVKEQFNETHSRICAFVAAIRLHVILEGVIDSATQPSSFPTSPFLAKAAAIIARRLPQNESLRDEEALLEEWTRILPKYWQYDDETAKSRDPIRITQAERLHCLEHLVKMLIYRHRFSGFVAMPASTAEERARHLDLCRKAMQCALTIIADHVHISQRGMMTYYGVHVIHQLAQAGRTLVAVSLNCRSVDFRPLIAPSIEGLRSCVGLLRRFSGRYLCGLRSADIIDEFCRICNIPVDSPRVPDGTGRPSPAWLRPVRKRSSASPTASRVNSASPAAMLEAYQGQDLMSAPPDLTQPSQPRPTDLETLFNTSEYFDPSAMSPVQQGSSTMPSLDQNIGEPYAPYDRVETLMSSTMHGTGESMDVSNGTSERANSFDYASGGGFGGEMLAGAGMDNVSDGLKGADGQQGLSAATILSLLEEGSFDYGSIFTDQAPLPMDYDDEGDEGTEQLQT